MNKRRTVNKNDLQFRTIVGPDKAGTVFHTWHNFAEGANPIYGLGDKIAFMKAAEKFAAKHSVDILDLGVMDDHIHSLLHSRYGIGNISAFWKSLDIWLAIYALKKGIKGPIFANRVQYSRVKKPLEAIRVARYINNNGKADGHYSKISLENEFRYMEFEYVNYRAWREITGLEMDALKLLITCPDEELLSLAARFRPVFKKKANLYSLEMRA